MAVIIKIGKEAQAQAEEERKARAEKRKQMWVEKAVEHKHGGSRPSIWTQQ